MSEVSLGYSIIGCLRRDRRLSIEDIKNHDLPGSPTKMDIWKALGELVQLGLVEVKSGIYFLADIPKPHPNSDRHDKVLASLSVHGASTTKEVWKDTGLSFAQTVGGLTSLKKQGRVINRGSEDGMVWEVLRVD
jgi:hypothetical protein